MDYQEVTAWRALRPTLILNEWRYKCKLFFNFV
jgi:hypothetical protein